MRRRTFSGISRDIALIRQLLNRHLARTVREPDRARTRPERTTTSPQRALKANA